MVLRVWLKDFLTFSTTFSHGMKAAFHVSTGLFWWKNDSINTLIPNFCDLERETCQKLTKIFPMICQRWNLCLQRSIWADIFSDLQQKPFQIFGEFLSARLPNMQSMRPELFSQGRIYSEKNICLYIYSQSLSRRFLDFCPLLAALSEFHSGCAEEHSE